MIGLCECSVFQLRLRGSNRLTGQTVNGALNLIDLAGSERLEKSEAKGDRLKEAQHINKSLATLGDVMAALAAKDKHVPYRNSKLTHMLQGYFGGDCKVLMLCNLNPAPESVQGTAALLLASFLVSLVLPHHC